MKTTKTQKIVYIVQFIIIISVMCTLMYTAHSLKEDTKIRVNHE